MIDYFINDPKKNHTSLFPYTDLVFSYIDLGLGHVTYLYQKDNVIWAENWRELCPLAFLPWDYKLGLEKLTKTEDEKCTLSTKTEFVSMFL